MKKVILLGAAFLFMNGFVFSQKVTNVEEKPKTQKAVEAKEKPLIKNGATEVKAQEVKKPVKTATTTTTKAVNSTGKETGGVKPTNTGVVLPSKGANTSTSKKAED